MKRSELKVGDVLYLAKPRDYREDYEGTKVTVLATTPHHYRSGYVPTGMSRYQEVNSGGGVLVEVEKPNFRGDGSTSTQKDVVQLAHLRGPYETELAAYKVRHKAAKDEAFKQAEQDAKRKAVFQALRERAAAAGVTVQADPWRGWNAIVSVADLTKLLDQVDGGPVDYHEIGHHRRAAALAAGIPLPTTTEKE